MHILLHISDIHFGIGDSPKESEKIITNAKSEADQFKKSGNEILKHSGRDLVLNIKASLIKLFDSLVKDEVKDAFSDKIIEEIIPMIVNEWVNRGLSGMDIQLSEKDHKRLKEKLLGKLSKKIKEGMVIKPNPGIDAGFKISEKDGDAYYDFTDEGIAESLIVHMNPVLGEIIMESFK